MTVESPYRKCVSCKVLYRWPDDTGTICAQCNAKELVDHPAHYGGDDTYEAIKVIEAWQLGFCLGNTVKYIARAGKKDPVKLLEDLKKAAWYLDREIKKLSK